MAASFIVLENQYGCYDVMEIPRWEIKETKRSLKAEKQLVTTFIEEIQTRQINKTSFVPHRSLLVSFSDFKVMFKDSVHDSTNSKRWLDHVGLYVTYCKGRQRKVNFM